MSLMPDIQTAVTVQPCPICGEVPDIVYQDGAWIVNDMGVHISTFIYHFEHYADCVQSWNDYAARYAQRNW